MTHSASLQFRERYVTLRPTTLVRVFRGGLRPLLGLAALVWLFAGQDLRASCGDYVMTGGDHTVGHVAWPDNSEMPVAPLAKCHGPNCHRQVPAPTNPSRDMPTLRFSERACWSAVATAPVISPARFIFDCAGQPLDGHYHPIEHPPRLAG